MTEIKPLDATDAAADHAVELRNLEGEADAFAAMIAPTILDRAALLRLVEQSRSDAAVDRVLRCMIDELQWLLDIQHRRYAALVELVHPGHMVVQ